MEEDRLYKIAMALTAGMTAQVVLALEESGVTPRDFFTLDIPEIAGVLNGLQFSSEARATALERARYEMDFVNCHNIRTLFLTDSCYPPLLSEAVDAPVLLFVLGNADLSATPAVSLVGTRRCTAYGTNFCKQFVTELAPQFPGADIISGLAYGIDAAAHTAALENNLQTVAVVAHGLDMIYPAAHRDLASRIIASGGAVVSEYPTGVKPLQGNFLKRNRIVAGLSELTIVAESEVRGGAMSTANLAFSYSREVMALPGRASDISSSGCNLLISREKARIYISMPETIKLMGWKPASPKVCTALNNGQPNLFPELDGDAAVVYNHLRSGARTVSMDELHAMTGIAMPVLMSTLTELEFDGVVNRLPGSRYELC